MNPTAIYSKSGKGVQEASGKTSLLQRTDRAVLAAIDGRATLADVAQRVGKSFDAAFQGIINQLDKDGFIRQVTTGAPGAAAAKPAAAAPAAKAPPKPAAKAAPEPSLGDLDFSSLGASKLPSRPAAKAPGAALEQTTVLAKAREEAEAKAAAEREKLKKEAEAKARAEMEAQARAEAEGKLKEQAAGRAKAEAEAKAKAAHEAAARAAAEAKAQAEAETRAKIEAETKAKLEAERKAREQAERKAKEEAERARKEAEDLRQRLEAERMAREAAERRAKQEAEAKAKLEAERRREEEEAARREAEGAAAAAAAAMANVEAAPGPGDGVSKKAKKKDNFADSLLADLESFTSQDDEEQAKKETERQELDRKVKEEAQRRRTAEEEEQRLAEEARRGREEEERRAEEEERRAQEDERRKREAEEIRRKAEAATVAAMAKEGKKHEPKEAEEDMPVSEDDADMEEVEREQAERAEATAREKEKERAAEKEKKPAYRPPPRPRRPIKWGKPVATIAALVLIIGVGAAHIVPLDTADYERASSEALGRTVKVGSAHLWLFSGLPEIRFSNVRVGDARIARVVATGWPGGLFGPKKQFSNLRIEGLSLPQEAIGDALFARVRADNLNVSSITIKQLQLPGPAALPKDLIAEATLDARGRLRSAKVEGPDGLLAKLMPREDGSIDFDVLAGGFTLPIAPQVTLSKFAMRGVATPRGMTISEWGGAIFQGGISGKATVRWAGSWNVDGVVTVRNINASVFAPALLSSGNADGTAKFSMSASDPAGLVAGSRLDGTFTVSKGTLGSFDLARYIQSGGRQATGTTQFAEMNGQATYDRGTVALRNVNIGAGRLNAGASADIAAGGALSGRIVADMRTEKETQRVTLLIGGTVKEPQVRN